MLNFSANRLYIYFSTGPTFATIVGHRVLVIPFCCLTHFYILTDFLVCFNFSTTERGMLKLILH